MAYKLEEGKRRAKVPVNEYVGSIHGLSTCYRGFPHSLGRLLQHDKRVPKPD